MGNENQDIINQQLFNPNIYTPSVDGRLKRKCKKVLDITDMKIVNLFLHDMINIQKNDTGMRLCDYTFSKASSKKIRRRFSELEEDPQVVQARELTHIEPTDNKLSSGRTKQKRYSLFCENGDMVLGIRANCRKDLVVTSTKRFRINEVDPDIRNTVMGWFE